MLALFVAQRVLGLCRFAAGGDETDLEEALRRGQPGRNFEGQAAPVALRSSEGHELGRRGLLELAPPFALAAEEGALAHGHGSDRHVVGARGRFDVYVQRRRPAAAVEVEAVAHEDPAAWAEGRALERRGRREAPDAGV